MKSYRLKVNKHQLNHHFTVMGTEGEILDFWFSEGDEFGWDSIRINLSHNNEEGYRKPDTPFVNISLYNPWEMEKFMKFLEKWPEFQKSGPRADGEVI